MSWTDKGEWNDDGELVYERTVANATGISDDVEVNLSKLLSPGQRRTANTEILRIEAELVAEGIDLGNPAKPADHRTAKTIIERLESEGLEPAWRVCERESYP